MNNFNEYNPDNFKKVFINSDVYNLVTKKADIIFWNSFYPTKGYSNNTITPREFHVNSIVTIAPFYYLQYLTEVNPTSIYDIGCGMNYFKRFFPNIIGIGEEGDSTFCGDIHDSFNKEFAEKYKNKFESAFSINAIHFVPLTTLRDRIIDFVSVIKPGGRGFLALNFQRLIEYTTQQDLDMLFPNGITPEVSDRYVREQFDNISNIKMLCVDIDVNQVTDEWMNGNIRVVFEKLN